MATTTTHELFAVAVQKSETWIDELMNILGWDDPQRAYAGLRATLHALRDRLPTNESAQLASQLPQLLRGVWYEGWKPSAQPLSMRHIGDFYDAVQANLRSNPNVHIPQAVDGVFKLLAAHISPGKIRDVVNNLPDDLRTLWR